MKVGARRRMAQGVLDRFGGAVLDFLALAAAVIWLALLPSSWRRPVRAEFVRFIDRVGVTSAPLLMLLGLGVGAGLVAQAVRLLKDVGQEALIRDLVLRLLVEQIAPIVVGLALIGRAGLTAYAEISAARRTGALRALSVMGIDHLMFLVMPRCVAAALAGFCLTAITVGCALGSGYVRAEMQGVGVGGFGYALAAAITTLGPWSLLLGPLKAALFGFSAAVIFSAAALTAETDDAGGDLTAVAFFRALFALFALNFLFAAAA
jgi:phospholipid/cholesterol/gamma-HCH transport system permease protein